MYSLENKTPEELKQIIIDLYKNDDVLSIAIRCIAIQILISKTSRLETRLFLIDNNLIEENDSYLT